MTIDRTTRMALVVTAATVMAVWFGVRPLHVRAASLENDVDDLRERIAESSVPEAQLDATRVERDRRRSMLAAEGFESLPDGTPDVAGVIRRLSLPIDGDRVLDQTFTAGRAGAAANGAPDGWRATPVRVEVVGDWSAIRDLLDLVDDLPGPVRTTALRLNRTEVEGLPAARLELELDVLHRDETASGEETTS